jgi:hypothetical protein
LQLIGFVCNAHRYFNAGALLIRRFPDLARMRFDHAFPDGFEQPPVVLELPDFNVHGFGDFLF